MAGMKIGYARTSTAEQVAGLEAQHRDLEAAGCGKVFSEQLSSVDASRPQLAAALDYLREGDTLVVKKLDRLARSTADLLAIADKVMAKGAALSILDQNLDTSTPTGKLLFTMVGAIAQFERELMLERQREGIAKAKDAGKYKGRKPTARAKADQVREMLEQGVSPAAMAKRLEIARSSVYRILDDLKASGSANSN
jgi:DNA invertase Pin-like site-specific DNA recombinase